MNHFKDMGQMLAEAMGLNQMIPVQEVYQLGIGYSYFPTQTEWEDVVTLPYEYSSETNILTAMQILKSMSIEEIGSIVHEHTGGRVPCDRTRAFNICVVTH